LWLGQEDSAKHAFQKLSQPNWIFVFTHPIRIRILKMLESSPMAFGRLKNELGLSSSGNLDFHLNKLEGLVVLDSDGLYRLSDEGKEALMAVRIVETSAIARSTPPSSQIRWVLVMCGAFFTVLISATIIIIIIIITVVFLRVFANSGLAGLIGGAIGGGIGGLYGLWKGMRIESRMSRPLSYWPTKSNPWQMGDWTAQAIFIGGQMACAYCILYAWLMWGLLNNISWACMSFLSVFFIVLGAGFVSQRIIAKANRLIGLGS